MNILARLAFSLLLAATPLFSVQAQESRAEALQRIEEMVARCGGDKTCELVVRKRETRLMERAEQDRALKQSDPLAYYFRLWWRYLAFVFAIGGAAALYVFVMRRLFGRK